MAWTQIGAGVYSNTVEVSAAADGLSGAINLKGYMLQLIIMPATWTAAALSAQLSLDGSTYVDFFTEDGEWSLTSATVVAASRAISINADTGIRMQGAIKFRSGLTGAAVQQGAARTLTLVAVKLLS